MKRQVQFALMIAVFVLAFIMIHFYVLSTIFSLFHLQKSALFYSLLLFLSFSYVLAAYIERKFSSNLSRAIYIAASTWLGALLFLVFFALIYDILSLFLKIPSITAGIIILVVTSLLVIYGIIHGYSLKINHISLRFDKKRLKKDMRIVHLSDIHLGTVNTKEFLEEVVEKTNSLSPDIVAMTGDLVDGSAPMTIEMLNPLNKIKAPIFFVIGNHEIYDELDFVLPILEKTKMKIIRNAVVKHENIQIAGIDYCETDKPAEQAIRKLKINKNNFAILLNHAPSGFKEAVQKGFDLQLSGHTHNGQIFPFNFLVKLRYKFLTGLHKINNSFLFISQGTGTWGPPMRIFTNSEVVAIDLKRIL